MSVYHVLKDGSRIDNIRGHVVKREDAGTFYQLLDNLNRRSEIKHNNEVKV